MDSSSYSSEVTITRAQFNAFHSFDRALFTRIVMCLRGDIIQSFQVMCFLIYTERAFLRGDNLISELLPLSDHSINTVVDEVMICLRCLSSQHLPTFLSTLGNIASSIPWLRRMSGDKLTLGVIHQKRREIIREMEKILNTVCYPAFEDICVHIEMQKERNMSTFFQSMMCGGQETSNHVAAAGTSNVHEGQHEWADDRTVFLKFSKGYPISEAEVHAYFTWRYGDIVEAIHMGGVGGKDQATYASLVLRSAAKIPEILNDGASGRTKFSINGKYFWARRFIPNRKTR